jgi:hypothetical protein
MTDLFKMLGKFEQQGNKPPVESWNPEVEGEIDILIDKRGDWYHEGGYFERQDLARMFSSILRLIGDDYYLVTPAEKLKIKVDDVPFLVVLMDYQPDNIRFITSLGDEVVADKEHPIEFRANEAGEQVPYVHIRNGLWARLKQSVYYELADFMGETPDGYAIRSGGEVFIVPQS